MSNKIFPVHKNVNLLLVITNKIVTMEVYLFLYLFFGAIFEKKEGRKNFNYTKVF